MDSDLVEDLEEALEGVDPVEFLLADPDLMGVAEEVWGLINCQEEDGSNRFEDVTATEPAVDGIEQDHLYDNGAGLSLEMGVASPASSSGSPWSDASSPAQPVDTKSKRSAPRKRHGRRTVGATCLACDRPARGYHYYGVVVCNSCRAFFARAIKDDAYKNFICEIGGIENACCTNTKSCQKCRFNLCLKIGMTIPDGESSKTANCSKTHNENVNLENKRVAVVNDRNNEELCAGYGNIVVQQARRLLQLADTLTEDEKLAMQDLTARQVKLAYISIANLVRSNINIFVAAMEFFYEGKSYPLEMHKQTEDYMLYHSANNREALNEFPLNKLKKKDVSKLIMANFPLAAEYVNAYNMNKRTGVKEQVEDYINTLINEGEGDKEFKEVIRDIYSKVIFSVGIVGTPVYSIKTHPFYYTMVDFIVI